jgi:hypothetical protein
MPVEGLMSERKCGCGRTLEGRRSNAETCSDACRVKRYRKKHPPILPGPPVRDLIAAYSRKLESKTAKARESFSRIADALAASPLIDRRLLTITGEDWERWLVDVTHVSAESTRALWRRYLRAAFKPNPHFLAAPPPRPPRPPVDRAASHSGLLVTGKMPKTERARLVLELVVAGFTTLEVQEIRLDEKGRVRPGLPAWDRRSMPTIPPAIQDRLMDYAADQDLCSGDFLFTISKQAITQLARRWLPRQTPCSSSVAAPQTA